jgi:hypothetical protein
MTTTVYGTYLDPSNDPCIGRVVFRLVAATYHDGLAAIFPTVPVTAILDDGAFTVELEPTSGVDADLAVDDMTYQVTERINGTERDAYYIDVPSEDSVNLGALAVFDDPPFFVRQIVDVDLTSLGTDFEPADPVLSIVYNGDGTVDHVVSDGVTTSYTYNGDGTIHTQTRLAVTRTYTYTAGNLTGVA